QVQQRDNHLDPGRLRLPAFATLGFLHDRGPSNRLVKTPTPPPTSTTAPSGPSSVDKNPGVHDWRSLLPTTLFLALESNPSEVLSAAVNGSSRAVSLDKITSVHDRKFFPLTMASPAPDHDHASLACDSAWMAPPGPPRRFSNLRSRSRRPTRLLRHSRPPIQV